ncbi:hypothetical protein BO94DRAFT_539996 [Aspergillus sclerotioniger CBS 115572]|uniref:C2H2-type domain-containing protein n=1 Tax=Aspergillus sclerotioniger CBS 115572 TaxID=1450535 RepID=A0A317V6K4_9EURO|nr:hypothetical protein BO94DRAFT_539996 [Aspergillus sclerotioniger CBS 115572]PWY69665.1 hypothetical protein BO94DRAFT_539996 [Aspergillus sclerotioniger CBS 115572]
MPRASGNNSFARPDNQNDPSSPPDHHLANGMFPATTTMSGAQLVPNPWTPSIRMNGANEAAMGLNGPGAFVGSTHGSVTMGGAAITNPVAVPQMQVPFEGGLVSQVHSPSINYTPHHTFNAAPTTRPALYLCRWLTCTETFQRHGDLKRHVNTLHLARGSYICPYCGRICNRKDNMKNHLQNVHGLQL